jgi:hypothetical protein
MKKVTSKERETYERLLNQENLSKGERKLLEHLKRKIEQQSWNKKIKKIIAFILISGIPIIAALIEIPVNLIDLTEHLAPTPTLTPTATFTPTPTPTFTPTLTPTPITPLSVSQTESPSQSPPTENELSSEDEALGCLGVVFFILVLAFGISQAIEQAEKEKEKEKKKRFVKYLKPRLRKRILVCEQCINAWEDEYADLEKALREYAKQHPGSVKFQNHYTDRLEEHIREYHPSLNLDEIEDKSLSYIVRGPTFLKRLVKAVFF